MIRHVRRASPSSRLALLAALALAAAGCSTARNSEASGVPECQQCHGGVSGNAAPPRSASGATATTALGVGAHQAHLGRADFRPAVRCDECHVVPASGTEHINGVAEVAFSGGATLGGATPQWSATTATCSGVYCHGATLAAGGAFTAPVWNAPGQAHLGCTSCHGAPPPSHAAASTACNACHPATVKADGTIDVAGGHHMNGVVEASGHVDFSSPATHGPRFFAYLGGDTSLDCKACHGADYGGGSGPSCTACHAAAGWTAWSSNCSFCHGARNPTTQAGYDVAAHPTWAAPPDALAQRLDPAHAPVPARTGAHQAHLTGLGSTSGAAYVTPAIACATCHAVPGDLSHAGGAGRAPVALVGSGSLPAALGSYDQATGTCTTYCHGTTLANAAGAVAPPPVWTGAELGCAGCHGNPPASGQHAFHVTGLGYTCSVCHTGTVDTTGAVGPNHVDGVTEVVFITPGVATWDGAGCTARCHTDPAVRAWR